MSQGGRSRSLHGDELIGGNLTTQLDHRDPFHRLLSPNSSAPPDLLQADGDDGGSEDGGCDGPSSGRSTPAVAEVSASDSIDTDEGTLQDTAAATADRRMSLFVTDFSDPQRHKDDHRRKSAFGRVVWNLDHMAEPAQKVEILQ